MVEWQDDRRHSLLFLRRNRLLFLCLYYLYFLKLAERGIAEAATQLSVFVLLYQ
jgi:hypothetical protein